MQTCTFDVKESSKVLRKLLMSYNRSFMTRKKKEKGITLNISNEIINTKNSML